MLQTILKIMNCYRAVALQHAGKGYCTAERTKCNSLFYVYDTDLKLRQYRIILSADTASEVRQLLSQKRR